MRSRTARTFVQVLTVLALGSITTSLLIATSSVGPRRAFATTTALNPGVLGVGDRTVASMTTSPTAADRVAATQPVRTSNPASIVKPAVRRVVAKPRPVTIGTATAAAMRSAGRGPWRRAKVSWYGPGFYGNTMAGGGKLRRNSMVVAHKSMPFGTKILFSHKGRTILATVRDRGPYVRGRTFDLGPGTARALRFSGVGVVKYRIVGRARR